MNFYYLDPESKTTVHTFPNRPNNYKNLIEISEVEFIILDLVRRVSIGTIMQAIETAQKLLGDK